MAFFNNRHEAEILELYRKYREAVPESGAKVSGSDELQRVVAHISDVMLFCDRLVCFLDDIDRLGKIWDAVAMPEQSWLDSLSGEEIALVGKACSCADKRFGFPGNPVFDNPDKFELYEQVSELVWTALQHYLFLKSYYWQKKKAEADKNKDRGE